MGWQGVFDNYEVRCQLCDDISLSGAQYNGPVLCGLDGIIVS